MRVGILASSLSRGGAERQAALWAAACREVGWDVEVLVLAHGPGEYALPSGVPVSSAQKRGALDLVRVARAVRALAHRVDVLAAFQPYMGLFCAAQPLPAPWVLVTGDDPRRFGDTSRIPARALGAAVRRATLRCAPTRGLAECHRALGLGQDGWEVVPNVAAPEGFAAGDEPRDGELLWVGRLVPQKDPLLAVAAAREAGLRLTLLGEGPLREEARRAGGDGVVLEPFTPAPWALYRRHRALLLTSRYEPFGNVIIEALAAGTPVVAADCDFGPREVLAGVACSRVVARDPGALARALREVAAAPPSPAVQRECRERAQAFSLRALAPRIAAVLERTAGRS